MTTCVAPAAPSTGTTLRAGGMQIARIAARRAERDGGSDDQAREPMIIMAGEKLVGRTQRTAQHAGIKCAVVEGVDRVTIDQGRVGKIRRITIEAAFTAALDSASEHKVRRCRTVIGAT